METPRISDIPSIKKLLTDSNNFVSVKRLMPLLRPLLRILSVDVTSLDKTFAQVDDIARQVEELASIPDRFNALFASRGWIIYGDMNLDVAKAAIEKAESGRFDEAETDIVEYYSPELVRWMLRRMQSVKAFIPRVSLAEKALTDYEEERYHACVPVVLALLDGFVNDIHKKQRGFFSAEIDLKAWDSIAAHDQGLNKLTAIFQKGRYKTTTEQITIPYRNGILHGMDLGYDNKIVAAKSWAALFSVREWAVKAEKDELSQPPEEPQITWKELFQKLRENEADKESLAQWKPRHISVGIDVPETGVPDIFLTNTPERKLAEYLVFWKQKNYGHMARCLSSSFGLPAKKAPAEVRRVFITKEIDSFAFTEIRDEAPAITIINTNLMYEENGENIHKSIKFRLINIDANGNPAIQGKQGTEWKIINWSVY